MPSTFFATSKTCSSTDVRPRRRHAVIGDTLVNSANQMWALVRKFETEVAAGIRLGASRFLHPLAQLDQYDVISACRLVGGSVLKRAAEGLCGAGGQQKQGASNKDARLALDCDPARAGSRAEARPDPS